MYSIIFLSFSSLIISLVLTPVLRDLFLRWKLVDVPDQRRRLHARPIPRLGGIPVAVAFVVSHLLLLAIPLHGGDIVHRGLDTVTRLLPAVVLIFAVGLIDDLITLRPWTKLVGQLAACTTAWFLGVRVAAVHGFHLHSAASLAITLLWLLACTNAFNLIDGVDGLAAGIGLVATLTTLVAALFQRNMGLVLATVPLAGALLGFLRYNFNPATIFLGDSGSLLIGFLLGCYGVVWSQKSATLIGVTAPLMALAVPLLEVGLSVARRYIRGQPIFGADRGHIHHRLLDRGLTPRRVVLVLYACTGLFAALSLLATFYRASYGGLVVVLFCAVAWFGIQNLNYAEFGAAGKLIVGGSLRHILNSHLLLQSLEDTLREAQTPNGVWDALREFATQVGFTHLTWRHGGIERSDTLPAERDDSAGWEIRIPFPGDDEIAMRVPFACGEKVVYLSTPALVRILRTVLEAKAAELAPPPLGSIPEKGQAIGAGATL